MIAFAHIYSDIVDVECWVQWCYEGWIIAINLDLCHLQEKLLVFRNTQTLYKVQKVFHWIRIPIFFRLCSKWGYNLILMPPLYSMANYTTWLCINTCIFLIPSCSLSKWQTSRLAPTTLSLSHYLTRNSSSMMSELMSAKNFDSLLTSGTIHILRRHISRLFWPPNVIFFCTENK